jgi:hypothetical protein
LLDFCDYLTLAADDNTAQAKPIGKERGKYDKRGRSGQNFSGFVSTLSVDGPRLQAKENVC